MRKTTDWRAVCGRTARTVRRAGTAKAVPDPYQVCSPPISLDTRFRGYDGNNAVYFGTPGSAFYC